MRPEVEMAPRCDLLAQMARHTPAEGANACQWPGLTFYRFDHPLTLDRDAVGSLAFCVVGQGRLRVRIRSVDYLYDPFHYLVMSPGLHFQAQILQGSPARPFLSFVLEVHPEVVTEILQVMPRRGPGRQPAEAYVTPLQPSLKGAVRRFLSTLDTEPDRQVLAPIYLREMVYRLLRCRQWNRLVESAVGEADSDPVKGAIRFMKNELGEPITVRDVAFAVGFSESALAHLFKAATGASPYQFLKQLRLEQARDLLVREARSVTEAASEVGYTSRSHFIAEFKRYFGETPKAYSHRLRADGRMAGYAGPD
jgi:AraC-like DNA-binding protein